MPVVLGIDIGTTNLKCYAYNHLANIIGKFQIKLPVITSEDGKHEIEPDVLWHSFQDVIIQCLKCSNLDVSDISCMGISTQRGTFLTWDRETGETYHNFITWKDRRSLQLCNQWNTSLIVKMFRAASYILYLLTRDMRYNLASKIQISASMVLMRLYWIMQNNREIRDKIKFSNCLFGTIDTWIIWKLTGGKVHATDSSNACVTGFFDPILMEWSSHILNFFNIPLHVLPEVKNTSDNFGKTSSAIFGVNIPLCAVVGDQQASMFGSCCFNKYDVNCTMGTGLFVNMNTGSSLLSPHSGTYPLVGWTISSKATYILECGLSDCGTVINWAQNLGLFQNPVQSSCIAKSINGSRNLFFLPSNSTLTVNNKSTVNFIGMNLHHTKNHITRSILESFSFQVCLVYEKFTNIYGIDHKSLIQVCGGVGKNDFIIQQISNVLRRPICRLEKRDSSSLGAAFLAGLQWGIWNSQEEIRKLPTDCHVFHPEGFPTSQNTYQVWKKEFSRKDS